MSIRNKILLGMLVLALTPLAIIALQGLHCARHAVIDIQEKHLLSMLRMHEQWIQDWVAEREGEMALLGSTPSLRRLLQAPPAERSEAAKAELGGLLDALREQQPAYESVIVYDAAWVRAASTSEATHSDKAVLATEAAEPHAHEGGQVGLHKHRDVETADGEPLGAIVVNLQLSTTIRSILHHPVDANDAYKVYLLSIEGHYLVAPGAEPLAPGVANVAPGLLNEEPRGIHEYRDYRGRPVLGVGVRVPALHGILVAEIDREQAFRWIQVLANRALTTAAVILVLAVASALWIAGGLSRPLRELARVSSRIATGQHQLRLAELRGREAGAVASAFNNMLDQLETARQELAHAASLAAVGELSASLVHEMRSPMSSIKLNLEALRQAAGDDADLDELGRIAARQTQRLERMLDDLLQYGKPLELRRGTVKLDELAAETVAAARLGAGENDVRLTVRAAPELPEVQADPELLQRALGNLLDNAVKASPEGGAVEVAIDPDPARAGHVKIAVTDAGAGIPEDIQGQLFRPFFTTRDGGTGLGLANVKKIAEYHGGVVNAENCAAGGACFSISLPCRSHA